MSCGGGHLGFLIHTINNKKKSYICRGLQVAIKPSLLSNVTVV
jgi:hypothetical protein